MSRPNFHIRQLPATASQATLERAAAVLDGAFEDTPLGYLWNGTDSELSRLRKLELVTTTTLDLQTYVAETDGGEFVGVMLVKPPGFEHRKSPNVTGPHADRVSAVVAERHPDVPPRIAELFKRVTQLKHEAYGDRDVTDMYYISHIGTLPEWKGAGVGAALLRHLNDKLDGHKSSLLAVSEQLVEWYGRFGYKSLADKDCTVDGGPPLHFWAMAT